MKLFFPLSFVFAWSLEIARIRLIWRTIWNLNEQKKNVCKRIKMKKKWEKKKLWEKITWDGKMGGATRKYENFLLHTKIFSFRYFGRLRPIATRFADIFPSAVAFAAMTVYIFPCILIIKTKKRKTRNISALHSFSWPNRFE